MNNSDACGVASDAMKEIQMTKKLVEKEGRRCIVIATSASKGGKGRLEVRFKYADEATRPA
jgi:imidazole glycerol phosphate synthase subunit HisF